MKLISYILDILHARWSTTLYSYTLGTNYPVSMKEFIKTIYNYYMLLDECMIVLGSDIRIGISGRNSMSFIACYIAAILKNVDFYLISPNMSISEKSAIISNAQINILFCDVTHTDLYSKVKKLPYFKYMFFLKEKPTLMGIEDFTVEYPIQLTSPLELDILFKSPIKNKDRRIGVFTSGTTSSYPRAVYFDDDSIMNALIKLSDSNLLPELQSKMIFSNVNFADAPIYTILWPLANDGIFRFTMDEAEIVIYSNAEYEEDWAYVSKSIYEKRWIGKLLLKHRLSWLFNFLMKKELRNYFNFKTYKDAIIVLNASLAPRIVKISAKSLPFYTTYGIQEANQVVAINNYSTKQHLESGCVGEIIDGIGVSIKLGLSSLDEGSLVLAADHLSPDLKYEKGVYFDTRDHASITSLSTNKTLLFIYGKISSYIKNTTIRGANIEMIERVIKNVPAFKEVLLYDYNDERFIFVNPNSDIVELKGMGILDFKNSIKPYKSIINTILGYDYIFDVKITFEELKKTHTGNIKRSLYKFNDFIDNEL